MFFGRWPWPRVRKPNGKFILLKIHLSSSAVSESLAGPGTLGRYWGQDKSEKELFSYGT